MAQSGYTPIITYYSTTAAAVPLAANLASGELSLNISDMKLYCENAAGAVTLLASAAGASGTVTSVAASVPSIFSIAGSPITSSGTLAMTYSGTALPVANGGTGLTTGTSGGILAYTASGTLASSGALTQYGIVYGGGAGVAPTATANGTTGQVLTATTSGAPSWAAPSAGGITYTVTKTATYTAVANDGVLTNTTGGAFTVNLPASPANGDQVIVADAFGVWGTNNLTVGRNGNNIAGVAQDLVCDINGTSVQFVYNTSGTASWDVFAQIGGNGGTAVTLTGVQTLTNKTLTAPTIASANLTTALTLNGAAGTNGQVLTSAGSGLPTWATPAGISSAGSTITTSTTLTAASAGYQPIAMTAMGKSVTLPDATTVTVGSPKFYLNNASGSYPVGIRNTSGTLLMAIAAGGTAFVSCQDISTAAGVWNITGDNLEIGLITIDNTFSSTYGDTRLLPFVAFDSNKSLHFLTLSSGFAAVAVDNTTGAVGTPVTVSATASMTPLTAFLITTTTAIVFYSSTTGTLIGVVITLSGATTLTVGTPSSTLTATGAGVENFSAAPKIAQLAATLYLVSYATATGAGTTSVAAFQVSGGTTVNLGSAVNIIAANNIIDSTTTYGLTATTALVIYTSGAAAPYTISAVVISVTNANPPVCTVGTPTAGGTRNSVGSEQNAVASCPLSSTKVLVTPDTGDTIVGAQAFTISGTTVTVGAVLTVEATAGFSNQLGYTSQNIRTVTRYNPVLFPLTATTALLTYFSTASISRVVILTESAGTVTNGTILYNSVSSAANNSIGAGYPLPMGTTQFTAVSEGVPATTASRELVFIPHKISGTTITCGAFQKGQSIQNIQAQLSRAVLLSSGDLVCGLSANGNFGSSTLNIVRSNGDYINYRGSIKSPNIVIAAYPIPAVASNRIIVLGKATGSTINANSTFQMRLINIEIAS